MVNRIGVLASCFAPLKQEAFDIAIKVKIAVKELFIRSLPYAFSGVWEFGVVQNLFTLGYRASVIIFAKLPFVLLHLLFGKDVIKVSGFSFPTLPMIKECITQIGATLFGKLVINPLLMRALLVDVLFKFLFLLNNNLQQILYDINCALRDSDKALLPPQPLYFSAKIIIITTIAVSLLNPLIAKIDGALDRYISLIPVGERRIFCSRFSFAHAILQYILPVHSDES